MRCDTCGKFRRADDLVRRPVTQADYLFGDPGPFHDCKEHTVSQDPRAASDERPPSERVRAQATVATSNAPGLTSDRVMVAPDRGRLTNDEEISLYAVIESALLTPGSTPDKVTDAAVAWINERSCCRVPE